MRASKSEINDQIGTWPGGDSHVKITEVLVENFEENP